MAVPDPAGMVNLGALGIPAMPDVLPDPHPSPLPETGEGTGIDPELPQDDQQVLDFSKKTPLPPREFNFECPPQLLGDAGKLLREKLGKEIVSMLSAADSGKGDLLASGDRIDRLYLGREVQSLTPLWDDAPTYNAQTMRNKIQDLAGYIVGPMTANDPWFIFRAGGPKGNPVDAVQSVVHFFMHRGRWDLALEECCNLTCRRGVSPMRVSWAPTRKGRGDRAVKARFIFEAADTQYFTTYPNTAKTFEEMRLFGVLEQRRVQEVRERQKAKRYFDDREVSMAAVKNLTMGDSGGDLQAGGSDAVLQEDHPVDIFSGILRYDLDGDGFEEQYQVVVAKQLSLLLFCEEHQLDQPNYADFFFEKETGRYFPEASVGTALEGPHHHVNDTLNMSTWLTTYVAAPPMFAENFSYSDEVIRSRPGELTPVDSIGNMITGGGKIDLGMFPGLHELARRIADECSHIAETGSGGQFKAGTTATAASQSWAGQMAGVSRLTRAFSFGAVDCARIVMEFLYWNYDDWSTQYADSLPATKREDFEADYWIEVNGETPNSSPQAVLQQITLFLQALMPILQAQPNLLVIYPDLIPGLVRAFLESTTIPGKEGVLPTREEEAAAKQQASMQANIAQTVQQHLGAAGAAPTKGLPVSGDGGGNDPAAGQPGMGLPVPPVAAGLVAPPEQS